MCRGNTIFCNLLNSNRGQCVGSSKGQKIWIKFEKVTFDGDCGPISKQANCQKRKPKKKQQCPGDRVGGTQWSEIARWLHWAYSADSNVNGFDPLRATQWLELKDSIARHPRELSIYSSIFTESNIWHHGFQNIILLTVLKRWHRDI